jgi:hypothetical protein
VVGSAAGRDPIAMNRSSLTPARPRQGGMQASGTETVVTLNSPGRVLAVLESCIRDRIAPGRSGWSSGGHLSRDLERFYRVHVPRASLDRALRELVRRGCIRQHSDADGLLWYHWAGATPRGLPK